LRQPPWRGHHAGVVDQEVELVALQSVHEGAHRREVGQVEGSDLTLSGHGARGLLALLQIAARDDHAGAVLGQLPRRDEPDAAVGSGDDRELAALIRHVLGRPATGHQAFILAATESEYASWR